MTLSTPATSLYSSPSKDRETVEGAIDYRQKTEEEEEGGMASFRLELQSLNFMAYLAYLRAEGFFIVVAAVTIFLQEAVGAT